MSYQDFNAAEVSTGGLKEYRVYGPPGTGKTTWMTRQIALAAKKYGGKRILACSFTRTAAAELTARLQGADVRVPDSNVGTIHSLCFKAAGNPTLAETKVADWNNEHPHYQLSKKNAARAIEEGETEDAGFDGSADALLAQYNILRNQLVPLPDMPYDVACFATAWESWKAENDLMDFTDLLSMAGMDMLYAPNNTTVAFVDEAQDLTPLQLAVVRNWARSMSHFILAGDDDQCLYTFSGASPETLISDNFPADHKIVLSQSYRVPRAVHSVAERWISRCQKREPKEYKPNEVEGRVRTMPQASYKYALAAVQDAQKQLAEGRSVMFLAACSYMLRTSLLPTLKDKRVPYWNPYRTTNGEWNPINGARRRKVMAFIHPEGPEGPFGKLWSLDQLEDWLPLISAQSWLKRGAKEALKRVRKSDRQQDALYNWYCDYFQQPGFDEAHLASVNQDSQWLQNAMPADKRQGWQYTFEVLSSLGNEHPRCVVGTIHSVKGGEADCVYLFPDLSPQAVRNLYSPGGADDIVRQFYVGITRARQELVLCAPSTRYFADIPG